MVDQNLIKELDVDEAALEQELAAVLGATSGAGGLERLLDQTVANFQPGHILKGRVANLVGDEVILDVGLKSEGVIPLNEWDDPSSIDVGDEVDVWLESIESD